MAEQLAKPQQVASSVTYDLLRKRSDRALKILRGRGKNKVKRAVAELEAGLRG